MPLDKPTRRRFNDAARAAALEARRRKRETQSVTANDGPEVFVVRQFGSTLQFHWELRRFGGGVLDRSETAFSGALDARSAGERALSNRSGQVR